MQIHKDTIIIFIFKKGFKTFYYVKALFFFLQISLDFLKSWYFLVALPFDNQN